MFKIIKQKLIKLLAREIIHEINSYTPTPKDTSCKNLAGVGGQQFNTHIILFHDLVNQSRDPEVRNWRHDTLAIRETIFYEYFAPFEHWCDNNCQGGYYLWADNVGICRVFTDPRDEILYRMIFSRSMSTMDEIYQIVEQNNV